MPQILGAVACFLFVVFGMELVLALGLFPGLLIWTGCAWILTLVYKGLNRRFSDH